jgi:L-ribulokinase
VNRDVYTPDVKRAEAYDALYAEYRTLHDYFGRGGNDVMHRLRELRRAATSTRAGRDVQREASDALDDDSLDSASRDGVAP